MQHQTATLPSSFSPKPHIAFFFILAAQIYPTCGQAWELEEIIKTFEAILFIVTCGLKHNRRTFLDMAHTVDILFSVFMLISMLGQVSPWMAEAPGLLNLQHTPLGTL